MCGPEEEAAVRHLARLPHERRRAALGGLVGTHAERGLVDFLGALVDEGLIDELAQVLSGAGEGGEAEAILSELWSRLVAMISPEARDVLYAHHQLRLMVEAREQDTSTDAIGASGRPYKSALDNARAVLAATSRLGGDRRKTGGD